VGTTLSESSPSEWPRIRPIIASMSVGPHPSRARAKARAYAAAIASGSLPSTLTASIP